MPSSNMLPAILSINRNNKPLWCYILSNMFLHKYPVSDGYLYDVSNLKCMRKGSKTYCKLMFYELSSDILVEHVWAT